MRPPGAHQMLAGLLFQRYSGPNMLTVYMRTATSLTFMLWVAGGNCATKMCNRVRGERYRGTRLVTLPYLKLSVTIFINMLYYLQ